MLTACDEVVKVFLPALKASVARELAEKHGFTQDEIAKAIGVTQAAVSKYAAGRSSERINEAKKSARLKKIAAKVAQDIAVKHAGKEEVAVEMCEACASFRSIDGKCAYRIIGEMLRK